MELLENINAVLIEDGLGQKERLTKLKDFKIVQFTSVRYDESHRGFCVYQKRIYS